MKFLLIEGALNIQIGELRSLLDKLELLEIITLNEFSYPDLWLVSLLQQDGLLNYSDLFHFIPHLYKVPVSEVELVHACQRNQVYLIIWFLPLSFSM